MILDSKPSPWLPLALTGCLWGSAWASVDCSVEALQGIAPEGVQVTLANRESTGTTALCLVEGTMPTAGNQLRFRLGLPQEWSGKFLFEAMGGGAGKLVDVIPAARRGYAVATTDTGHVGHVNDFEFWFDQEQRTDWIYRGVHTATVGTKALVRGFYGRGPEHAFLRGCSNGGRQGLMEAQRYPMDYDGILSGAPAADVGTITLNWILAAQVTAAAELSSDDWELVGRTVREACDAKDGLQDGLIQDDRRCKLPRGTLGCTAEKTWDCLDAAKLAAVERLWNKPILSNGRRLPAEGHGYEDEMPAQFFYAGASPAALLRLLMFSSKVEAGNNFELSAPAPGLPLTQVLPWLFVGAPSSVEELTESYSRGVLLPGRSVDVHTFDVAGDGPQLAREIRAIVDVTDQPDLNVFLKRGSKLLLWHGLADTTLPPGGTIEYFDLARERWLAEGLSADAFDRAVRLYTAPAIGHCTGGSGPNEADLLGALDAWVTAGNTPEAITTVRRADDGTIARSRILCPMPQEPRYVGQGSIDDARSFTCAIPPDRVGTTGFRSSPPLGG